MIILPLYHRDPTPLEYTTHTPTRSPQLGYSSVLIVPGILQAWHRALPKSPFAFSLHLFMSVFRFYGSIVNNYLSERNYSLSAWLSPGLGSQAISTCLVVEWKAWGRLCPLMRVLMRACPALLQCCKQSPHVPLPISPHALQHKRGAALVWLPRAHTGLRT